MTKEEYYEYLNSEEWNKLRISILKRDRMRCRDCGASDVPLQVHHTLYLYNQPLSAIPEEYLISLCKPCHSKRHKDTPGWMLVVWDLIDKKPVFPVKEKKPPRKKYKPKRKK